MSKQRVAVLIDADNIPASLCDEALKKCAELGNITIKRAYGDFTNSTAASWRKSNSKHAIVPMQNNNLTKGKNAADIALVIDAMDFLHNNQVDIFCIVSSDSDFTRLATRLRECGRITHGFGEKNKSVTEFVSACTKFTFISAPKKTMKVKKTYKKHRKIAEELETTKNKPYLKAFDYIVNELEKMEAATEWITFNNLQQYKNKPAEKLNYTKHGSSKLKTIVNMVHETKLIEVKKMETSNPSIRIVVS